MQTRADISIAVRYVRRDHGQRRCYWKPIDNNHKHGKLPEPRDGAGNDVGECKGRVCSGPCPRQAERAAVRHTHIVAPPSRVVAWA